jgi:hypothetical protein
MLRIPLFTLLASVAMAQLGQRSIITARAVLPPKFCTVGKINSLVQHKRILSAQMVPVAVLQELPASHLMELVSAQ